MIEAEKQKKIKKPAGIRENCRDGAETEPGLGPGSTGKSAAKSTN